MISPFDISYYYQHNNINTFNENKDWIKGVASSTSVFEFPVKSNLIEYNKNIELVGNSTDNIYLYLARLDNKFIFTKLTIIILTTYFFHITINKWYIGFLLSIFVSYIISRRNDYIFNTRNQQLIDKYDQLLIKPQYSNKYPEYIDFLFSIQDIGKYNLDAFRNLINSIDNFLILYDDINIGVEYCKQNYDIAQQERLNALNHLHSLVYSLEPNQILVNKLNESIKFLQQLTNNYLYKIKNKCNTNIIDYKTEFINDGPYSYNKFDHNNFTFDLF